jgi:DNA-binding NarL/FixJ family response regulator
MNFSHEKVTTPPDGRDERERDGEPPPDSTILVAVRETLYGSLLAEHLKRNSSETVFLKRSVKETVEFGSRKPVDLLIVDYDLPEIFGLGSLHKLIEREPSGRTCILLGEKHIPTARRHLIREAVDAGVAGFLLTTMRPGEIGEAVSAMLLGAPFVPVQLMVDEPDTEAGGPAPLTRREFEVLGLIAQGTSNKVIAARLGLKEVTVKMHVQSLFKKLGVTNRTEAVVKAKTLGLL